MPTRTDKADPLFTLAGLMGGTSRFIEEQEKNGQTELVNSESFPTKINGGIRATEEEKAAIALELTGDAEGWDDRVFKKIQKFEEDKTWELLKSWGFKLGKTDPNDKMFRTVTLPAGWKRRGSSHSMWSYIDDDKGRERISIFYKAAFYDRESFFNVCRRFRATQDHDRPKELGIDDGEWHGQALDGKTVLYRTEGFPGHKGYGQAPKAAEAWLDENRPGWRDLQKGWEL